MILIDRLSENAIQLFYLKDEDGNQIQVRLRYLATQEYWVVDIEHEDFTLNGFRVVNSPNFLRQFRNKIPFGIDCVVEGRRDPYYIDDFSSQKAQLMLLTKIEVDQVERDFFNE